MLKSILNLEGAQMLTVVEQKNINGGSIPIPGECNMPQIIPLSEAACRRYNPMAYPVYIGSNQCSIIVYCP